MTLAEEIRTRRKSLGLTQAELAERIGTSQGRLGDYERGEVEPTITTLRALASVLGPFTIGEEMDARAYAEEIVEQMSTDDVAAIREAGGAEGWRDGMGQWPDIKTPEDLDAVLEAIYEIVSE